MSISLWKWKSLSRVRLFATPWTIQSVQFSRPDTGVGSISLLQGIFPTQGLNPGLPHCRWILYQLNHKGSPWILEWIAYPFSSGSSWPRNWTGVSCTAGGFFTNGAIDKNAAKYPTMYRIALWKKENYSASNINDVESEKFCSRNLQDFDFCCE